MREFVSNEKSLVSRHSALPPGTKVEHRPMVRLSREQQLELVRRYQAGALRDELAKVYGVSRGAVSSTLRRNEVELQRGLSKDQIGAMIVSHLHGTSAHAIARQVRVSVGVLRAVLQEHGLAPGL